MFPDEHEEVRVERLEDQLRREREAASEVRVQLEFEERQHGLTLLERDAALRQVAQLKALIAGIKERLIQGWVAEALLTYITGGKK